MNRTTALWACLAVAFSLLAAVAWPRWRLRQSDRLSRANLWAISLAAERYSVGDPWEAYPLDLEQLRSSGLLHPWPLNPYTGQPVRQVDPGEPASAGDITYLSTQYDLVPGFRIGDGFMVVRYVRLPDGRVSLADVSPNADPHAPLGAELLDWPHVSEIAQSGCSKPSRRYLRNERLKELGLPPSAE